MKRINKIVLTVILWILITGAMLLAYLAIKQLQFVFKMSLGLLIRNFGTGIFDSLTILISTVMIICVIIFFIFAYHKIFGTKPRWCFWAIIFFSLIILATGVTFLNEISGVSKIEWPLYLADTSQNVGTIKCEDLNGRLIYENHINCIVNLADSSLAKRIAIGNLGILYKNGTKEHITLINTQVDFIAHIEIAKLEFKLRADLPKNETKYLHAVISPEFLTKEEDAQRKKDFLTYFFGLLFVCIVTIPHFVLKMREAWGKKK